MPATNTHALLLPDHERDLLEAWLAEFDQSWNEGRLAERVRELPATGPLRFAALVEMVKIDLERCWQRGHPTSVEAYLHLYPELGAPDTVAADLVLAEYEARQQAGAAVAPAELAARFPRQAEELWRQAGSVLAAPSTFAGDWTPAPYHTHPWARLPEVFGRYRIVRPLGRGGMGSVYLAHDPQLERLVALKVPRFALEDSPEVLARFQREARAAAALRHPHVCPVYDVGQVDGVPYLTMAYIEGQTLAERIQDGPPLPVREAVVLVRQLAQALEVAHGQGVIHRDLKPANVLLNRVGEPAIADFGLARRMNERDERLTPSGALIGTPTYMSPEQVEGRNEDIGPGADVYALGVILYELLTGNPPFRGALAAVLAQVVGTEPERPSLLRPDLDPQLETIVMRAMMKKVEARYASMGPFVLALTDYLDRDAALARPANRPVSDLTEHPPGQATARLSAPVRRGRRPTAPFVVVACVVLLLLGIGALNLAGVFQPAEKQGPLSATKGDAPPAVAPTALDPALKYTFKAPRLELPRLRAVAFSPDWKRIVVSGDSGEGETAVLWDLEAGKVLHTWKHNPDTVCGAAFDPKGKTVALGSYKQVSLYDVSSGKKRITVDGFPDYPHWISFSREGKFLHFVVVNRINYGKELFVAGPASGKLLQRTSEWSWNWTTSGDGNTILAVWKFGRPTAYQLHAGTGKFEQGKVIGKGGVFQLSKDGSLAATADGEQVVLHEVSSGKEVTKHDLHTREVTGLALSTNGKRIASVDSARKLVLWDGDRKVKENRWDLEGLSGKTPMLVFSRDGTVLAAFSDEDKQIQLWAVPDGKRLATIDSGSKGVVRVYFSPDRKRLAAKDTQGHVKVWDLVAAQR
jgi:WD40 repeat protein